MGKHSSPERLPFLRSVAGWALPWILIAAVIVVAAIVGVKMVKEDPIRADGKVVAEADPEADDPAPEPAEEETPEEEPEAEEPEGSKEPEEKPAKDDKAERQDEAEPKPETEVKGKLITRDIQVQVLNGTAESGVDDVMADKLARLGYTVVAVSPAAKGYPETVVYYTGGSERIGELLSDRYGWKLEKAPSNLSNEVALHIVVGEDRL